MATFSKTQIVGAATSDLWSQVHTFEPSKDKLASLGGLCMVVRLSAPTPAGDRVLDLPSFGKEIIHRFNEQYYGTSPKTNNLLSHLRSSAERIIQEFQEVGVEIVAGVYLETPNTTHDGIFYVVCSGGQAVLFRDSKLYRLLGGEEPPSTPPASRRLQSASGFVSPEDVILLGSADFFRFVPLHQLQQALSLLDPKEIGMTLAPLVHGQEGNGGVAAGVFRPMRLTSLDTTSPEEEAEGMSGEESFEEGVRFKRSPFSRFHISLPFSLGAWKARFERRRGPQQQPLQEEILLRPEEDRRRRLMLSVALLLFGLLLVSVFLGWRKRVAEERERIFSEIWETTDHQYQEALDLVELNPLRSRAVLSEAKEGLEAFLAQPPEVSKAQRDRLSQRLLEIGELLERVSGEYHVGEAPVFLDLSLLRPNTSYQVLALHGDTLVALDRASGVLVRVGISNKSAEAVGGGPLLSGATEAAAYAGRGFILSERGVVEVSLSGKTSAVVVERDPEWGEIIDLEVFGGNLYLLDRGTSEVFRYQATESGFGPRKRWFGEGVLPDLTSAKAMAIDGDIWILTADTILHFRQGVPQPFSLSGLPAPFSRPIALFTDAESERLYVLDQERGIIVLDKNGEYRGQYIWEGIGGASDFSVSEATGKIFLLSGSVIYEIGLRK